MPTIVQQPVSRTNVVDSIATFDVDATGTAPVSYQSSHNGAAVPGGTSARLVLTNVQPADAGTYSVRVSNAWGSAEASATLTVITVGLDPTIQRPDGQWRIRAHSHPGTVCELLASIKIATKFADWAVIARLTNTTGTVSYTDPVTNLPRRFCRLRQLP